MFGGLLPNATELGFTWQANDAQQRCGRSLTDNADTTEMNTWGRQMNTGSNRYRASLIREDAYFAEIDQLLLSNLREAIELQQEAAQCASGGSRQTTACDDYDSPTLVIEELASGR